MNTGYWDDMFYLGLDGSVPNRESLSSFLTEKYKARLLNTTVSDRGATFDENSTSQLIERWFIPGAVETS